MTPQDGAVVGWGSKEFEVHAGFDEDGGYAYVICTTCDGYVKLSDDAMWAHECLECPGCHDWFPRLPKIDAENGQAYCDGDCLDNASERYWTAVWTA